MQYTDTWTCYIYKESTLTIHTDKTPPLTDTNPSYRPTHSYTTPPQPKHRHMYHSPLFLQDWSSQNPILSPTHPYTSYPTPPKEKNLPPMYITSPPYAPICWIRQGKGSSPSLEITLHSQQQTYHRPSIHTTQNFKWSRYTLTTPNISQLQTLIYLLETAHPRTTKQLTRTYNTAYITLHYITNIPHSVLTGDVNAHSTLWHSYTDDHRGQRTANVISNSDHITLNTTTRVPNTTLQQTSSPDITTVSNTLYNRTSWTTQHAQSSDHLPIITTINIRHDYRLQ